MKKFARIIGTGSYLPPKIITNEDLEKTLDTSKEWIVTRTGIEKRHIVENQSNCELATIASQNALKAANISPKELDLIIFATTTPDKIFPATATVLQKALGASCPAFDLQAVCAGFIFALTTAEKYIKTNSANKVLVVGSETLSRIVDWTDRSTAILFGDGAGAVVLSSDLNAGILNTKLLSDGNYLPSLQVNNNYINQHGFIQMSGNEVFKAAIKHLSILALETIKENNITVDEIDYMIPHQANVRIITAIAQRINIPMDKVIVTLKDQGNTSAASIPLAIDKAVRDKRIKKNNILLLIGIGAGFSWGSVLLRF
jgi:3-oxoacyl-[acyl-carrier-protein] synthase-3